MKLSAVLFLAALIGSSVGCTWNRQHTQQPGPAYGPHGAAAAYGPSGCGCGCETCGAGGPVSPYVGAPGSPCPGCEGGPAAYGPAGGGPPTGAVSYPYYSVRGPRDFLVDDPPSIGP